MEDEKGFTSEDAEKEATDGEEGSEESDDEDVKAEEVEETHLGETFEVRSEGYLDKIDVATAMASGTGGEAGKEGRHVPDAYAGASCDHTMRVE